MFESLPVQLTFDPGGLGGTIRAIPSKSEAHRALLAAALVPAAPEPEEGKTGCPAGQTALVIEGDWSIDIQTTADALAVLGKSVERRGGIATVRPMSGQASHQADCRESGSTLRFLLPVLAAKTGEPVTVTGEGRLPERPLTDLLRALRANGARIEGEKLPLVVHGGLRSGCFELPGNVSSQYISGLLFALPGLAGDSEIRLSTDLESASYVELTIQVLAEFGVRVEPCQGGWHVPGGQRFVSPGEYRVSGDWSNAAVWLAAGVLGNRPVTVTGLANHGQGDRAILAVLRQFGAKLEQTENGLTAYPSSLCACTVDMRDIPDLLPVLAVVATHAKGTTRLVNAARLRLKESDRLAAVTALLARLGAQVRELPDALEITGSPLTGGTVDSANDHRLVMAAALASVVASEPVSVHGFPAIAKSYPAFAKDFIALGGVVHVV